MSAIHPGGGIRSFFRYIYSQPCFIDCTFTLIAPDRGLSEFLSRYVPGDRIKVVPCKPRNLAFIRQLRLLIASGEYDLLHSHGFSAGLLTEVARAGLNIPHLMTAHDVFMAAQFTGWKGRAKRSATTLLFRRMSAIHTVTHDAKANLLEFFPSIKQNRVYGILHGVDTEYFRDGKARNLKSELGLDEKTPLIGFFGRFMGQKGFRILVDAVDKIIKDNKLDHLPHVATFGWGGFIREDYQYIREKGLSGWFHQCEQTDDMPSAMKGVDIVAMPSRWEACGLLAMEALAAGVPIIGSQCIGLREVLAESPAQAIPVGSYESLEHALIYELAHIALRKAEFREYQAVAVESFHISRPASAIRDLYNTMSDSV